MAAISVKSQSNAFTEFEHLTEEHQHHDHRGDLEVDGDLALVLYCVREQAGHEHRHSTALSLQRTHERHEVVLFLLGELRLQDQVEELHRIFQRQQATVVQVGWRGNCVDTFPYFQRY